MKMKIPVLLLASFFWIAIANSQTSSPSADVILKAAFQKAANEKKNVFVMFHASWCAWCHKMDTALYSPVCKKLFLDNYVIEHLTVYESKGKENLENPGALALLTKYKGNDIGTPYWMIFDKDGNLLADSRMRAGIDFDGSPGDNVGCPASEEEVNYFISVLKKTSSLNANQLEVIRKRFRQNEH
jgi:thiol-disulfide isomerase/thioredoxin